MRGVTYGLLSLVAASVAMVACGSKHKSKHSDSAPAAAPAANTDANEIDAELTVTTDDSAGLELLATTATYSGSLQGCKTGKAGTFTDASSTLKVLVGDTGCYSRLDSVVVTFSDGSSASYTPDSAYKFDAGTSVIVSAGGSRLMKITVSSNLPSPIVASPVPHIAMAISFVEAGTSQTATVSAATAGVDLSVSDIIPYQLSSVALTVDGNTGGGAFVMNMNCYSAVGADNNCDGLLQTAVKGALGPDTYLTAGAPRNLTIDECNALAGGSSKVSPTSTFKLSDNNALMPNGGAVLNIVGPAPLCDSANANLVFAAAHTSTTSCKWWRIAVSCP